MKSYSTFSRNNILIGLVQGFYWMASCIFISYLVRLFSSSGYNDYESGIVLAVGALATLTIQPLLGNLSDRISSVKRLIVLCFLVSTASAAALEFCIQNRIVTCILVFVIFGSFRSLYSIIDLWSFSICWDDPCFSYGFTRSFGAIFYAVSAVLFGYAIDRFGTNIIIPCFIFLSLLDMLIVILIPERASIARSTAVSKPLSTGQAFKTILKNRQYIAVLLCCLLIEMSNTPMQNYLTRKFEVLGAGDIYTGLSFLIMGIMQLPALLCFDRIRKKSRPIVLMIVSFGGIMLRLVILGFAHTPIVVAMSFIVEPIGSGLYIGALIQYMKRILPDNVQYLGLSFYSAFTAGVAGLAGNYITGMLSDSRGVLAMMKLTTIPSIMGFLFFAVTSIVFMHRREA